MENIINFENSSYKENPYSFYINNIITRFPPKEKSQYDKIASAYNNCFLLAKQNKIEEAEKAYNKLHETNKEIFPSLIPWVMVFCAPNLSYFYYKIKDIRLAIDLTWDIIKFSKQLQSEGYQYLFFSEIQQLHNLSRIYFKQEDEATAVSLCMQCLSDIVNHSKNWKQGRSINGIAERELIDITQYAMIIQVATETCNRLIRKIRANSLIVDKCLGLFLNHLAKLSFKSISSETRYLNLDTFSLLMKRFLNEGIDDIEESDLRFISANDSDKNLLRTLYSFASYLNKRENIDLASDSV